MRDRFLQLVRGAARAQRLAPLTRSSEVIAARRGDHGGWELVSIRHGRLAGTAVSPRGADPMVYVRSLQATAEVVAPHRPMSARAQADERPERRPVHWRSGTTSCTASTADWAVRRERNGPM